MTKEIIEPVIADTSNSNVATTPIEPVTTPDAVVTTPIEPVIAPVEPVAPTEPVIEPVKEQPKGLLDQLKSEQKTEQKDAEEYWKPDWKEKIAGDDEKTLKQLDKYKTPKDLADAYKALQTEFSRTRPLKELPENPTDADISKYREDRGIPKDWKEYNTELDGGLSIDELDQPIVDSYVEALHKKNATPDEVKRSLQTYAEVQQKEVAAVTERMQADQKVANEVLAKQWGNETKANLNSVMSYMDTTLGKDLSDNLQGAILADGSSIQNNPELLNYFLKQAKSTMGGGTITPNGVSDYVSGAARLKEISNIQATNPKAYYNNPELSKEAAQIAGSLKR